MKRLPPTALLGLATAGALASACRDTPKPVPSTEVTPTASASAASMRSHPSASPAKVACTPWSLQNKKNAELEALVAQGDLCAMGELGPRLFLGYDVALFRRGAGLVKQAFEGGAWVSACWVFSEGVGMAPDWNLALACLQRYNYPPELILHLINGDGSKRFLDRAQEVVDDAPDLQGKEYFLGVIQEERSTPSKKVYKSCDLAGNTMELLDCGWRQVMGKPNRERTFGLRHPGDARRRGLSRAGHHGVRRAAAHGLHRQRADGRLLARAMRISLGN